jgi:hypothetical protein
LEPVLVNAADGVSGVFEPGRQDEKLIVLDLNMFQNMFRHMTYVKVLGFMHQSKPMWTIFSAIRSIKAI